MVEVIEEKEQKGDFFLCLVELRWATLNIPLMTTDLLAKVLQQLLWDRDTNIKCYDGNMKAGDSDSYMCTLRGVLAHFPRVHDKGEEVLCLSWNWELTEISSPMIRKTGQSSQISGELWQVRKQ